MVKVKICGITNYNDAISAYNAGADAIGFVFAESKRKISVDKCREILNKLPAFLYTIGVFKNNDKKFIEEVLKYCGLSALQFHGNENEEFCLSFARPVIKAISIKNEDDFKILKDFKKTINVLIDGKSPGSGQLFDHKLLKFVPEGKNVILAGGLTPDNVYEIVKNTNVFAVDVSSGVEKSPGIKSEKKIIDFVLNARKE